MKDQFEKSALIDVIEARYELVRVKQQKYMCRCGGYVETALGPERATARSRDSLASAIKVVLDKWLYHLPLERQGADAGRPRTDGYIADAIGSGQRRCVPPLPRGQCVD